MGIPVIINETDEHILHRLYFLGSRKILTKPSKDLKEVKTKKHKKTQKHKNSNRVGCPIKTFLLSNGASNFLSLPVFLIFFLFQMHFLPTSSLPKMHFPSDLQSTKRKTGQTSQMTLYRPLIRDEFIAMRDAHRSKVGSQQTFETVKSDCGS